MGIWLQSLHNIIVALLRKYETRSFKKCKQPFRESHLCCIRLDAFRLRCISTILLVHNRHADWYVHLQQHVITGLMCQLLCGVLLGARNSRSLKYYFESARVSWLAPYLILNIILNTKLSLVLNVTVFLQTCKVGCVWASITDRKTMIHSSYGLHFLLLLPFWCLSTNVSSRSYFPACCNFRSEF